MLAETALELSYRYLVPKRWAIAEFWLVAIFTTYQCLNFLEAQFQIFVKLLKFFHIRKSLFLYFR